MKHKKVWTGDIPWHVPTASVWGAAFSALHSDNSLLNRGAATITVDDCATQFQAAFARARKAGHVVITLTPMSGSKPATNLRKWQVWPFCPKDPSGRSTGARLEVVQ